MPAAQLRRMLGQIVSVELLSLTIILSVEAVSQAATPAELACARRYPTLTEYTFTMNVALTMRHFPWLRFGMAGAGRYVRGRLHVVHFTKMPFFARGFDHVDLSPLDPCMWPRSYVVSFLGKRGDMRVFSLRPRRTDPNDANPLVEGIVTLDPAYSTHDVLLKYAHGDIQLALTSAAVNGFRLPAAADVSINMPGQALLGHASLTNYALDPRPLRRSVAATPHLH